MSVETTEQATDAPVDDGDAPRWWWPALGAVMAVGLGIRLAFVLLRQRNLELVTGDAFWYHFQAKLVADGRGFLNPFDWYKSGIESPGGDHPPGFVLILAALDVLGIDSPQGQRVVLCFVGTASIAVIALLARHLGGWRSGLVAAGIAAVYPNIWVNDGLLQVETVFILATAVALLLVHRFLERPRLSTVLWLSTALLVGAMTRPEAILLYPFLVVPLVASRTRWQWRRRIVTIALAAVIPLAAFAPWVAYNTTRYDELVLISTGSGQTLAVGNCDLTYGGDKLGYWDLGCITEPQIDPPTETDPSVRDGLYREIALDYVGDHVDDLPKVLAARVGRILHLYQPAQQNRLDSFVEGRGSVGTTEAAQVSWYLLAPLAVAGAIVLRRRSFEVWPEGVLCGVVVFTVLTTFGVTRYRAGVEVVVAVFAAVAIDALLSRRWPVAVPVRRRDRNPEEGRQLAGR